MRPVQDSLYPDWLQKEWIAKVTAQFLLKSLHILWFWYSKGGVYRRGDSCVWSWGSNGGTSVNMISAVLPLGTGAPHTPPPSSKACPAEAGEGLPPKTSAFTDVHVAHIGNPEDTIFRETSCINANFMVPELRAKIIRKY